MEEREPPDLPDQPSEDAITDDRSVFAKWPTCPHCAIRMVMASEDAQRYAFMQGDLVRQPILHLPDQRLCIGGLGKSLDAVDIQLVRCVY